MSCLLHLVLIHILICSSNAYYLVPNDLLWDGAYRYCQTICNSNLASINTEQQQTDIQNTIQSRSSSYWSFNENPWIGLVQSSLTSNWFWTDNSSTITDISSFPWAPNEPTSQCTTIDITNYEYQTQNCSSYFQDQPLICNSCNGKLIKYAWISRASCQILYDTEYATILGDESDVDHANELFNLYGGDAWIGMTVGDITDITTYRWNDGTQYDFSSTGYDPTTCSGTCFPWIDDGPSGNGQCVHITDAGWETESCTTLAYALCNLPSELRLDLNTWSVLKGDFVFNDGEIYTDNTTISTEDNLVVVRDKYWYNGDEAILFEYRFSVDLQAQETVDGNKFVGIMIFNDDADCENCYYVAIGKQDDEYYLVLYRLDGVSTITLSSTRLSFVWNDGMFYILNIKMIDGYWFEVSIKDDVLIYKDTTNKDNVLTSASGHIGLYSSNGVYVKSKYLYISGTPLFTSDTPDLLTCEISFNAGRITTASPTLEPTSNPTTVNIIFFVFFVFAL